MSTMRLTYRRAALAAVAVLATACSRQAKPAAENADSAAMAKMPATAMVNDTAKASALAPTEDKGAPPRSLSLTSSQIAREKIRWGAVTLGLAPSNAAIPGQRTTDEDRRVPMVREGAVQTVDGKPTVFLVYPDGKGGARIEPRVVQIGARANGRVAVLRGLTTKDQIVTEGASAVKTAFLSGGMPKK